MIRLSIEVLEGIGLAAGKTDKTGNNTVVIDEYFRKHAEASVLGISNEALL